MARIKLSFKFLSVMLGSLILALGIPLTCLVQQQSALHAQRYAEQQRLVIPAIISSLQEHMLRGKHGSTRELLKQIRSSYHLPALDILRRDGTPAFGGTGENYAVPQLETVFSTGHETSIREHEQSLLSTVLFPLQNGEECHGCHRDKGRVLGVARISFPRGDTFHRLESSKRNLALSMIISLVLFGGIAYFSVRRMVLRPLAALQRSIDVLSMGGLSHRIHLEGGEEFRELEQTVNTMAGRLEEKYSGFESRCKEWTDQLQNSMEAAEDRARQLSYYSRDLATIARLTNRVFNADLSLDDMLDRFMRGITRGLGYKRARVCLIDRKRIRLEMKKDVGLGSILPPCDHSLDGDDPLVHLVRAAKVVLFDDVLKSEGASGLYTADAVTEPFSLVFLPILSRPNTQKCWEANNCTKTDCPAFNVIDGLCWQIPNTRCRNDLVEEYGDKLTYCMTCRLFPVIGVLTVACDPRKRTLRGRNLSVLRILTSKMGAALESHRLQEDNRELVKELLGLHRVTATALSDLKLDKALEAFMETAAGFPGQDACNFWLVSRDGRELLRKAGGCKIPMDQDRCPEKLPVDRGVLGTAFRQNQLTVEYNAAFNDPTELGRTMSEHGLNSVLAMPLSTEGRPIGVFSVYKRSMTPFFETEVAAFMLLANQAAMAINACLLNEELKSQNIELARSMRLTEGILSSMASGVMLLDGDGRIQLINYHGAAILKMQREKMILQRLIDLFPDAAALAETDSNLDQREIEVQALEGTSIPIGYSSTSYFGTEGEREGVIVIFRDLTEIKALQNELLNKERFAAMGMVVAGVAHEIRNPLFGISSIGQIFERELRKPAHRELVRALLSETKRLNRLVEELLIYGRPTKLALEPCDLKKLWEEVFDMYRDEVKKRGLRITGDYGMKPPVAYLDMNQVRQVFFNLLRNAIEATNEGGEINIRLLLEDQFIIFKIIDAGTGIPAESIEKVFDLFYSAKPKGTGLGLPICKKIVEDHGGMIFIESEAGRGAMVTVKLPYRSYEKKDSRKAHTATREQMR